MTRPTKNVVDYFPHIVKHGKTLFILESKYGNDGYAFWFKLLELLGESEGHVYDYNNPAEWGYLQSKLGVPQETTIEILGLLAEVGAIDKDLNNKKIIWSNNFVKGLEPLYRRRSVNVPQKPNIRGLLRTETKPSGVNDSNNPHSIVEYSIVEYSRVKDSRVDTNRQVDTCQSEQSILDFFNQECKKKLTLSKDRKKIIAQKLSEGKSIEDIKKAISNFSKDDWEDRPKYCDIIYAIGTRNKVDNFEKWLNYKPKDDRRNDHGGYEFKP